MSQLVLNPVLKAESRHSNWSNLYKLGGSAALFSILVALTDIALTFFPAGAKPPGTMTAVDWFGLFQENWFFGLRNLGLLPNILNLSLSIPIFLALYDAHKHSNKAYASLALVISLVGTAIYLSNNAAFPMLALSARYEAATTNTQRALLTAAGEAVLARGEDFTPGAFMGFLFSEIAMIVMALVMLRGGIFSKATAYAGILGSFFLTIFTIWSTFIPLFFEISMIFALIGGLLSITWYTLTARRFFQLGSYPQ
jgi:hypothetical protein